VRHVYQRELPRRNVATLGPLVQRACGAGDAIAARILDRAAEELALAAGSVTERLGMRGDAFPFVLSGGVFSAVPSLEGALRRRLLEVAPRAHTTLLGGEPALGALQLALAEARGGARIPSYQT
jgi:N-acetylglucosamine kinase-like BadF-type ATPase